MNGRGILIVSGVTPARFSEEEFERIYWGFGTHLGIGAVQSGNGDRLGYVQNRPDDEVKRGYRSLRELHMHTDSYEIVGLMCVRRAKSGGLSGLAPSLSIHNEILRTRPELLPPLYRGFRIASEEARFSSKAITDEAMPVFCYVDGKLSCMYEPSHMKNAAEMLGGMPDDLAEALDYFDEIANREDMALRFLLEPGDMMLWHNYMNLHSRTSFEDDPASPRLLLAAVAQRAERPARRSQVPDARGDLRAHLSREARDGSPRPSQSSSSSAASAAAAAPARRA